MITEIKIQWRNKEVIVAFDEITYSSKGYNVDSNGNKGTRNYHEVYNKTYNTTIQFNSARARAQKKAKNAIAGDNMLYKSCREDSNAMKETNDCSVVAVSVVTGVPYNEVHAMFKEAGRENRQGTMYYITDKVLNRMVDLGVIKGWSQHVPVKKRKTTDWYGNSRIASGSFTMKTIADQYPSTTTFMAFVRGHVAAVKGGIVQDWTNNRRHLVKTVYVIEA